MRTSTRVFGAIAVLGFVGAVGVAPAAAAVSLGGVGGPSSTNCTSNFTWVQDASSPSSPSYVIPAGGGVITTWSHAVSADTNPAATLRLKVLRKTGAAPPTYLTTGHSDIEVLSSPGLHVFETRISVQAGDRLGLRIGGQNVACFRSGVTDDAARFTNVGQPDPAIGDTFTTGFSPSTVLLNLHANLEPDADADGYGDETQDDCPGDPTTRGACPSPPDTDPPETFITEDPERKSSKNKAKYQFASDEAGSTFECRIDKKPFKACTSPRKLKVEDGKHRFLVRAIDPAGNVDASADRDKFKVLK